MGTYLSFSNAAGTILPSESYVAGDNLLSGSLSRFMSNGLLFLSMKIFLSLSNRAGTSLRFSPNIAGTSSLYSPNRACTSSLSSSNIAGT